VGSTNHNEGMESRLLKTLQQRVLIYDGAMGTQLQAANLQDDDFIAKPTNAYGETYKAAAERLNGEFLEGCNEILCFTRPDVVEQIHRTYLSAGADLIETNTFGASSIVLAEYDIPELDYDVCLQATKIARRAADALSTEEKPRFVIGALGPGTKLISLGQTTWDELVPTYRRCCLGLIDGGADAILLETLQDLLMVKAAVVAANEAMAERGVEVPLFVQVTMEQTGTMLVGSDLGAAVNMLECFPTVKAIGINCATGPVEMAPHIRFLSQNCTRPISVLPNAGLPVMEGGKAVYKLSPDELAQHHVHFVEEFGAAMVGGCCGTTPAHIAAVAKALENKPHSANCRWRQAHEAFANFNFKVDSEEKSAAMALVGCSSLYQFQPYEQDNSYLIIGEKTNANGSKAFREMLANENWDGLTELARELEGEGSHVLDVCTAYVGRNESVDMQTLLKRYNRHITVPIMVDSTELQVVEIALQTLAGKPIVNSINFEDGEARTEKVLGLCSKYGAAVVGLTIDEDGMAKTVEKKVEITDRILARTRQAGLPDHDVFIDALTFTLGSGDEEFRLSAKATIDAIAEIRRKYPRVNTVLGVSNVSFGLKPAARQVLNSAFLHEARVAGLTAAIVHASKILPQNRIDGDTWKIAEDLIYDRRVFANA